MYAINVLSRYCNNPGPRHIQYLKHLLRYVMYTKCDRLMFHRYAGPMDWKSILASHKENIIKGDHPELTESMADMSAKMSGMTMSGSVDKDFAMLMKIHHEGAIAMAKGELGDGKDEALKSMSKQIITDQTNEIKEFSQWLSTNK